MVSQSLVCYNIIIMRDFFYNKGDVLIAILIILVAAFVIYMRVGVVLDYSASGEREGKLLPMPSFFSGLIGRESPDDTEKGQTSGQTVVPPDQSETPPVQPPSAPAAAQITVVAGDAASTIADKLFDAGAISDKQAFLSEVIAEGADSKLKTGTFTIPAGATYKEIIKILVG